MIGIIFFLFCICNFFQDVLGNNPGIQGYRLPKDLKPIKYNLVLIPHFQSGQNFEGRVEVTFNVLKSTNKVVLHCDTLDINKGTVSLTSEDGQEVKVKAVELDNKKQLCIMRLRENLKESTGYVLGMNYTGVVDNSVGLFRTQLAKDKKAAATFFQPMYARTMLPCFDEPALKARFTVTVSRPGDMISLSNMPQDGSPVKHMDTPDGVGRYWDRFQETPMMSTYLLALVVGPLKVMTASDQRQRAVAVAHELPHLVVSLDTAVHLLPWFEQYTGIPYTLPKLDHMLINSLKYGGMENWGLVMYRKEYLSVEHGYIDTGQVAEVKSVVSHEIAHQWFGNLVTLDWWKYFWLNEGFATYFGVRAMEEVEPEMRRLDELLAKIRDVMQVDSSFPWRLQREVNNLTDIELMMQPNTHFKGSAVVRMMEFMLTPRTFRDGLRNYLKERSYKSATPEILYSHLQKQFHQDHLERRGEFELEKVMPDWLDQGSIPLVQITRDYEKAEILVTQTSFTNKKTRRWADAKWSIPLAFATQRRPDFEPERPHTWFHRQERAVVIKNVTASKNEWVLFNPLVKGYYRVNYDLHNWRLVASYLDTDDYIKIPPLHRAQLLDDMFTMADAYTLSFCTVLDTIRYLRRESDIFVWNTANSFLQRNHYLMRSKAQDLHEKFLTSLKEPLFKRVGIQEQPGDSPSTRMTRSFIVYDLCRQGYSDCVRPALEMFKRFREEGVPIAADVKSAVYFSVFSQGSEADVSYLQAIYRNTTNSIERNRIYTVYHKSKTRKTPRNSEGTPRGLDESITREVNRKLIESFRPISGLIDRTDAAAFIIDNFQALQKEHLTINLVSELTKVWKNIPTEQLPKLRELAASLREDETKRSLLEMAQRVEHTLWDQRIQRRKKVIALWLTAEMTGGQHSHKCDDVEPVAPERRARVTSKTRNHVGTPIANSYTLISCLLFSIYYKVMR